MFDFNNFNFDVDGDGVNDTFAQDIDLDGDGIADGVQLLIDSDSDGYIDAVYEEYDVNHDGAVDAVYAEADTNGDGLIDTAALEVDTDYDGYTDEVTVGYDYDGDGIIDDVVTESADAEPQNEEYTEEDVEEIDLDGDGVADGYRYLDDLDNNGEYDTAVEKYDLNNDGIFDVAYMVSDTDGDGISDIYAESSFMDTDGDGIADTCVIGIDENLDGTFEAVEVYEYDAETGEFEYLPVDESEFSFETVDPSADNFNPEESNPDEVVGDPEEAMEHWECQGQTNRCALYSQLFVIEDITGQEIDIEEFADIAEENGWFTEEGGTSAYDINKMLDYYGIENEMSFNNDINDIEECLENGGHVIVALDSDEIWYDENSAFYSPDDAADHAVQVIGIDYSDPDNPMVILNDSGHEGGCGALVPLDEFVDAWEDGGCQMVAVM